MQAAAIHESPDQFAPVCSVWICSASVSTAPKRAAIAEARSAATVIWLDFLKVIFPMILTERRDEESIYKGTLKGAKEGVIAGMIGKHYFSVKQKRERFQ